MIQHRVCISCGDRIDLACIAQQPYEVQDAMKVRCLCCAEDVLGRKVPPAGTLQHDTGGGRRVLWETKTH